jgi:hypothetical protein
MFFAILLFVHRSCTSRSSLRRALDGVGKFTPCFVVWWVGDGSIFRQLLLRLA